MKAPPDNLIIDDLWGWCETWSCVWYETLHLEKNTSEKKYPGEKLSSPGPSPQAISKVLIGLDDIYFTNIRVVTHLLFMPSILSSMTVIYANISYRAQNNYLQNLTWSTPSLLSWKKYLQGKNMFETLESCISEVSDSRAAEVLINISSS